MTSHQRNTEPSEKKTSVYIIMRSKAIGYSWDTIKNSGDFLMYTEILRHARQLYDGLMAANVPTEQIESCKNLGRYALKCRSNIYDDYSKSPYTLFENEDIIGIIYSFIRELDVYDALRYGQITPAWGRVVMEQLSYMSFSTELFDEHMWDMRQQTYNGTQSIYPNAVFTNVRDLYLTTYNDIFYILHAGWSFPSLESIHFEKTTLLNKNALREIGLPTDTVQGVGPHLLLLQKFFTNKTNKETPIILDANDTEDKKLDGLWHILVKISRQYPQYFKISDRYVKVHPLYGLTGIWSAASNRVDPLGWKHPSNVIPRRPHKDKRVSRDCDDDGNVSKKTKTKKIILE
jgi:hypothetical protein